MLNMHDRDATPNHNGRWAKGTSGNPGGRPKGSRNQATLAMESLLEGAAEKLINKALELALEGDMAALKLCLERILPVRRDRPIQLDLPPTETIDQIAVALAAVVRAIADGQITPAEGAIISDILVKKLKAVEMEQIESRLMKVEERVGANPTDILTH